MQQILDYILPDTECLLCLLIKKQKTNTDYKVYSTTCFCFIANKLKQAYNYAHIVERESLNFMTQEVQIVRKSCYLKS